MGWSRMSTEGWSKVITELYGPDNATMDCSIANDKVELDLEDMPDDGAIGWNEICDETTQICDISETRASSNIRPWGAFEVLKELKGVFGKVKIKQLTVAPGGVLSQQYHNHRSEHWICLQGAGRYQNHVTEGTIRTGESIYIPVGKVHRLENIGVIPLEILEIQLGESVSEEDIVRLEDKYGRCK